MGDELNVSENVAETATEQIDYAAEIERLKNENAKLKQATTNASADASSWKKKFRETQSEAERAEADRAEELASMRAELEGFRTAARVSGYTSKLMDCGYDAATATAMAQNLPEGISDEFFAGQKAFLNAQKQNVVTELMNKQPGLSSGEIPSGKPDYDSMSDDEYYRLMRRK